MTKGDLWFKGIDVTRNAQKICAVLVFVPFVTNILILNKCYYAV